MKICPNCGSKMESDVNFCTSCGADLRNVPTASSVTQAPTSVTTEQQPTQPTQPQSVENQTRTQGNAGSQFNAATSQVKDQINSAVKNFDANSLWRWFVNSWKHPMANQSSEKWYGWATLLAEDIIFIIGLAIGAQRFAGSFLGGQFSGFISNVSMQAIISLLIFLLVFQFGTIAIGFVSHKFIYGTQMPFTQYINKTVQIGNLGAICVAITFIAGLLGTGTLATLGALAATFIFYNANIVAVVGDDKAGHDKFYGFLIFLILQFILAMFLIMIFSSTLMGQASSSIQQLF